MQVLGVLASLGWATQSDAAETNSAPRYPRPTGPTPDQPIPGHETPEVALVRKHYDMFNRSDFENWVHVLAPEYRSYSPFGGPRDRQEYFDGVRVYKTSFPDIAVNVIRGIGGHGWAAAHIKYSATFAKDYRDVPATGKVWHRESMGFWRIEKGLIVEVWFVEQGGDFYDTLRA